MSEPTETGQPGMSITAYARTLEEYRKSLDLTEAACRAQEARALSAEARLGRVVEAGKSVIEWWDAPVPTTAPQFIKAVIALRSAIASCAGDGKGDSSSRVSTSSDRPSTGPVRTETPRALDEGEGA